MATNQERAILKEIQARLATGIQDALEEAAESFRSKVTQFDSPPRSLPGEYPHRETGQAEENISYGLAPGLVEQEIEGRWGVFGEDGPIPQFEGQDHVGGEHLQWLVDYYGRLGMEHSFVEDVGQVRQAFKRGTRRARR